MAIETILLAVGPGDTDRIEELADAVVSIADPVGANVILVHAFDPDAFERIRERLADSVESTVDLDANEVARRRESIREIGQRLDDREIPYEVQGVVGADAGERVVEAVEDMAADWVIVGGRERSPAGKAIFGSTAQEILISAPCPVTFVRGK